MLRNASIRTRVLAILALPVLVILVLCTVQVQHSAAAAGRAAQVARASRAQGQSASLIAALDTERQLSEAVLSGQHDQRAALATARRAVDPRLSSEGASLAQVVPSQLPARAREAVDAALSAGRRVKALRAAVDRSEPSPARAVQQYDEIIDDQVALPERLAPYVGESTTADALRGSTVLEQLVQALVDERVQGEEALSDGQVSPDERLGLVSVQTSEDALRSRARADAASAGARVPATSAALVAQRSAALGGAAGGPSTTRPAQWGAVLDSEIGRLAGVQGDLRAAATRGADAQSSRAHRTAWLTALGALAVVVVPGAVALLLVRGLTAPLLALTETAGEVRRRLPRLVERAQGASGSGGADDDVDLPEIPVRSSDEVGRLAAAFNEVNATTVAVAREQAALREAIGTTFTTLARRDQALLGRQLTFLDGLERDQDDPRTLSDLFVLDHLATRMRRNAESLLVLAGLEGGRRLRQPMAVSDVARTATGEVEDYQRVQLDLRVDPSVLAHLALSAAHLLAEVVENALAASPPSTQVVLGARWADQPGGAVVLWVADEGMGMSPQQRETAVRRLADTSPTAAVGATELGLFVVARLARRLGATVSISDRTPRGTLVEVLLPATALAAAPELAAPAAPVAEGAPVEAAPAVVDLRDATRRSSVFAGFRSRGAATADGGGQDGRAPESGGRAAELAEPPAAPGRRLAAQERPAEPAQPYVPARTEAPATAGVLPGRRGHRHREGDEHASTVPALAPFTPEPGEGQPLTRRERRVVETGRLAVVAARSATSAGGEAYQPETLAVAAKGLQRRERTGRDPVAALAIVPVSGEAADPAWPTPPHGQRAVGATASSRRDPAEVRRRLAGYQSGVVRGRSEGADQ